jgi:competence ComEA-like helix-hairpin-helix protein
MLVWCAMACAPTSRYEPARTGPDFMVNLTYHEREAGPEIHLITEPDNVVTVVPNVPLELNRATLEQLARLPGLSFEQAHYIIAYRNRAGRFARVDDLLNVKGMTPLRLRRIEPYLRVEGGTAPAGRATEAPGSGT